MDETKFLEERIEVARPQYTRNNQLHFGIDPDMDPIQGHFIHFSNITVNYSRLISASTVVRAILQVNREWQLSATWSYVTLEPIKLKFYTIDYVRNATPHAKNWWPLETGYGRSFHLACLFGFSNARTTHPKRGFRVVRGSIFFDPKPTD